MQVDFTQFKRTIENAQVVFLSTSKKDKVTVRSISIVNIGMDLYFYTAGDSLKAEQLFFNPNVALNSGRYQMEGVAMLLGDPYAEENKEILKKIQEKYPEALRDSDKYSKKENLLFCVKLTELREWVFDGETLVGLAKTIF